MRAAGQPAQALADWRDDLLNSGAALFKKAGSPKEQEPEINHLKAKEDEDGLLAQIHCVIDETEHPGFHGKDYRKVWTNLKFKSTYANKRREKMIMGKHLLIAPHRQGNSNGLNITMT